MKKPSTAASLLVRDEESQENQLPFVKKKKRMLSSNTSFFSGCTPIKEEIDWWATTRTEVVLHLFTPRMLVTFFFLKEKMEVLESPAAE